MIESLLKNIARNLDKERIPYMIIGGQAVLVWGSPRMTRDIDITLGIDTDYYPVLQRLCKRAGLKTLVSKAEDFVNQTKVLPVEDIGSSIRIDFIFSSTSYERQAIKRARKILIKQYPVRFASLEDIIIHKLFAGRAIDIEDIKAILIKNKKRVKVRYIKKWLSEFERLPEYKDLTARFDNLFHSS